MKILLDISSQIFSSTQVLELVGQMMKVLKEASASLTNIFGGVPET